MIVGKIYFLLVRIKIKHMELSIIRRETTGSPPNQYNESETITKFEIMDGAPVRGTILLLTDKLHPLILPRRGDYPDTLVPGRLRPHADVPRSQQEVQRQILPESSTHRRGEPEIFQATGSSLRSILYMLTHTAFRKLPFSGCQK